MIIVIETKIEIKDLVSLIFLVEEKMERKRGTKNDSRTCDIDIIDYNGQIIDFEYKNLKFFVPHKELMNRSFVLFPLQEVSPQWRHPKNKELVSSFINKLSSDDKKSILKIGKS